MFGFFLQNLCVCVRMKRNVLTAKPPIKQLFVFQNSEHRYQIHETKDTECDLHLGLSFQFCSRTLAGRGTCYFECGFTSFFFLLKSRNCLSSVGSQYFLCFWNASSLKSLLIAETEFVSRLAIMVWLWKHLLTWARLI